MSFFCLLAFLNRLFLEFLYAMPVAEKGLFEQLSMGIKTFSEMSEVRYRRLPQHDEHGILYPLLVPNSLIFPFSWI